MEKLKNDLLRNIGLLSRSIQYINDVKYKEFQLQRGQFSFLTRICENPGITFVKLSNMLKVDKTTTTKAVNKLIDLNYVYKINNKDDKREFNIMPTEKALEVYPIIINNENRDIDKCFTNFTIEEEQQFLKLLEKLTDNFNLSWIDFKKNNSK